MKSPFVFQSEERTKAYIPWLWARKWETNRWVSSLYQLCHYNHCGVGYIQRKTKTCKSIRGSEMFHLIRIQTVACMFTLFYSADSVLMHIYIEEVYRCIFINQYMLHKYWSGEEFEYFVVFWLWSFRKDYKLWTACWQTMHVIYDIFYHRKLKISVKMNVLLKRTYGT